MKKIHILYILAIFVTSICLGGCSKISKQQTLSNITNQSSENNNSDNKQNEQIGLATNTELETIKNNIKILDGAWKKYHGQEPNEWTIQKSEYASITDYEDYTYIDFNLAETAKRSGGYAHASLLETAVYSLEDNTPVTWHYETYIENGIQRKKDKIMVDSKDPFIVISLKEINYAHGIAPNYVHEYIIVK